MIAARRHGPAGGAEVWAARAWNVFNEGRPFSVVFPALALLAAAPLGLAPEGQLWLALATHRLRRRLEQSVRGDAALEELLDEVAERRLDPASAAARLLEREQE